MSEYGPLPGGGFLGQILGDLAKLLGGGGGSDAQKAMARQFAVGIAAGEQAEGNVDPALRMRLEEIVHVAELHVTEVTGMPATASGRMLGVVAVTRSEWAARSTDAWWPLFQSATAPPKGTPSPAQPGEGAPGSDTNVLESLGGIEGSGGLDQFNGPEGLGNLMGALGAMNPWSEGDDDEDDAMSRMLSQWASAFQPVLLGMQFGSAIGHLAHHAMGQYRLPLRSSGPDELVLVPTNMASFAQAWGLQLDDVLVWTAVSETCHHVLLSRRPAGERIEELVRAYLQGFEQIRPDQDWLARFDPADPATMERLMSNPEELLGDLRTPAQDAALKELSALVAVVLGFVDHVIQRAGRKLLGAFAAVDEAFRRARIAREEDERLAESLFGLQLEQSQHERGSAFISGVIERAGEERLVTLWSAKENLPTPAEVDAPGLWLARLEIDADS
ncbi:MAG: zinc-dependent metalloprotease [Actinobacteria bacterium]|nr:zinc-dependent metalloprotease [Actinomycetota bacterium]